MNRMRFVLLSLVGMFLLAACGSSAAASTSSPSASPSAGPGLRSGASGQLVQINPQTLILSGTSGDTTVAYSSSTTVTKTSTGTLGDIVVGVCIVATGTKDASGSVTATNVRVAPNGAAGCGSGAPSSAPVPGASPRPTPSGQANLTVISGQVTAVSGTSITVLGQTNISQTLTIQSTAGVSLSSPVTAAALQVGQCVRATGTTDSAGKVTATSLTISPAGASGTCASGSGSPGRGGFGGGTRPTG